MIGTESREWDQRQRTWQIFSWSFGILLSRSMKCVHPILCGHSPVWTQSRPYLQASTRWWFLNSTAVFTIPQPTTPHTSALSKEMQMFASIFFCGPVLPRLLHVVFIWFMKAQSLFQLVLMLQCFNCHNTVVSTDKSTRYAEKIMGKNPVLLTRPNSSTGRICLGSCREGRYVEYRPER